MTIVFGAGGHAKLIAALVGLKDPVFVDQNDEITAIREIQPKTTAYVGIGNNEARMRIGRQLLDMKVNTPNIVGPNSYIDPTATIGVGNFIGAGALVLAHAQIGNFAIVNTMASVDHDCIIEEGTQLAAGVHLGGGTRVGADSLLGMGVVTLPGISIGRNCQIMAGSVVHQNIPDNMMFGGNPGRLIKKL